MLVRNEAGITVYSATRTLWGVRLGDDDPAIPRPDA